MEINLVCSGNTIDNLTDKEIEFINSKRCMFVNQSGFINKKIGVKKNDFIIFCDGIPFYQNCFWKHKTEKVDYILVTNRNMLNQLQMVYKTDFDNHFNETIGYEYNHEGETTSAMALSFLVDKGYEKINVFGLDMVGSGFDYYISDGNFNKELKERKHNYDEVHFFARNISFISEKANEWNKKSNIILRTKSKLNCFEFLKIK